jgi:mono/diheme cytochrome c family protein
MTSRLMSATIVGAALLIWSALEVAPAAAAGAPTFSKEVAPILYKNCANCHRPGEIAPMSLLTYEQARPWAKSIREKVLSGQMPPWHAREPRETFVNDRRLTDSEKNTLIAWVDAGAPPGDAKDLPPAPQFAEGWQIGRPDLVLSMPKAFDVPASGTIAYQFFTIPTNFTEDKWIQALEIRPGTRSVVHHILAFVREPGKPSQPPAFVPVVPRTTISASRGGNATQQNQAEGPGTLIATTAPGTNAMIFEPGSALKIPAGSSIVFQVHYTANGKAVTDQSSVGLIFAKGTPQREIHISAFMNPLLKIPAGAAEQAVDSAIEFTEDTHITALFPHTHLRGKGWEYRLIYPDGQSQVVLSVPKYDFNWQTYYVFTTPLVAPKGSRLEATAHYDNSVNNKWNPDPKVDVRWGQQTWEEMQYSGITYYVDPPASAFATSVDGKWTGRVNTPAGNIPFTFTFRADGATLTGSMLGMDGSQVPIKDGKADGSNISFNVTLDLGGGKLIPLAYKGVVSVNEIKLAAYTGAMTYEYVAKKVE